MTVPFIDLPSQYRKIKSSVDQRLHRVLDHGQYIMGPEVKECEEALAKYTGAKYALTCSNGTDALVLALMAIGVGPGDEVIVPTFSFIATAEAAVLVGATPVFVDVEPDTFNLNAESVEQAITSRTKAIMPVSLFGQTADVDKINALANRKGLTVIEDAAQSFGAEYHGRKSCALSTLACTSFFPAKPLGCYGDGGAVFTNDDRIHKLLLSMRVHGQDETNRYLHPHIGMNGRMDSLQCAVILSKMEIFPWEVEQRQMVAKRYDQELSAVKEFVQTPAVRTGRKSAWAQYTLRVQKRTELQQHLKERGIPSTIYYPRPMHRQEAYTKYAGDVQLPVADQASECVLSLPIHPYLEEEMQKKVTAAIKDFYLK